MIAQEIKGRFWKLQNILYKTLLVVHEENIFFKAIISTVKEIKYRIFKNTWIILYNFGCNG